MDKELLKIRREKMRKIMEILNKKNNKTIFVRIFDALVQVSSCGSPGCGCETSVSSPNIMELQTLSTRLIEKYGRDKIEIELFNVLDPSIKKFKGVYNLFKERKGNGLPIISINGKIKFFGRVPSFEEVESEIQATM